MHILFVRVNTNPTLPTLTVRVIRLIPAMAKLTLERNKQTKKLM